MQSCKKCNSTDYRIEIDSRGVASAFCAECGAFIKKMSTIEVIEYYQQKAPEAVQQYIEENRPPCKYCTETWGYKVGRVGQNWRPMEDIKYCPVCGRELKPEDKAY